MEEIIQVIVRNTLEKGLDVVATNLHKSEILDFSLFLPEETPHDFNNVFLTKFQHTSGNTILRFTFDDGIDQFGRKSIKTHTFIIDNSFYNEKTALYFISPLINGNMNKEENYLLKKQDFELLDPHRVSSKFIELVLCKKHVQLMSQKKIDVLDLIHLFGTLDRIIPPPLNSFFAFQTMVSPSNYRKKRSLVFSLNKLSHSQLIEQIQREKSEFPTIQAMTDIISDLSSLRLLQKKIFLGIPEKKLNLKLQWRFGLKNFSHIRDNLNNYFF